MNKTVVIREWPETKRKLVEAGVRFIRSRGYHATSVDDICEAAGVTKGGFFHYFKNKDDLAKAALELFGDDKAKQFESAPFQQLKDPLARVFGRLDFAVESSGGPSRVTKGCLIGVLAQELAFSNPGLRDACHEAFMGMARAFAKDLEEAKSVHAPEADFDPGKVAALYVSIIQGSNILAKTEESNEVIAENLRQFRVYLEGLFQAGKPQRSRPSGRAAAVVTY